MKCLNLLQIDDELEHIRMTLSRQFGVPFLCTIMALLPRKRQTCHARRSRCMFASPLSTHHWEDGGDLSSGNSMLEMEIFHHIFVDRKLRFQGQRWNGYTFLWFVLSMRSIWCYDNGMIQIRMDRGRKFMVIASQDHVFKSNVRFGGIVRGVFYDVFFENNIMFEATNQWVEPTNQPTNQPASQPTDQPTSGYPFNLPNNQQPVGLDIFGRWGAKSSQWKRGSLGGCSLGYNMRTLQKRTQNMNELTSWYGILIKRWFIRMYHVSKYHAYLCIVYSW